MQSLSAKSTRTQQRRVSFRPVMSLRHQWTLSSDRNTDYSLQEDGTELSLLGHARTHRQGELYARRQRTHPSLPVLGGQQSPANTHDTQWCHSHAESYEEKRNLLNVHAGANYTHSSGCVVPGFAPNCSSSYQESLEQDLVFKAAVACAMRIKPGVKINTYVSPLPPL